MPMWHVLKGTSKTEYEASNLPASYKFGKEERYKARTLMRSEETGMESEASLRL